MARCPGGEQDEGDDGCGQGHAGADERGAGHGIGEAIPGSCLLVSPALVVRSLSPLAGLV
jgi:hypothetical protein